VPPTSWTIGKRHLRTRKTMRYARPLPKRAAIMAALIAAFAATPHATEDDGLSVRITSPLGRSGIPGTVRIVAQVRTPGTVPAEAVKFFIDQKLLASVSAGPPYAAEWVDENPFERREITVEVADTLGHEARDKVVLEPLEVNEASEVSSVLLEASVQDERQRFVRGLDKTSFSLFENGIPQTLDIVRQEDTGATFALLLDSSASMSRRIDFAQRTAATLAGFLRPQDRILIAPFSKTVGAVTGPTNDKTTILDGIRAIQPSGGTAILDCLTQVSRSLADVEGRRAIVLITDGYDEQSSTTFEEALASIKKTGATLYVVGIGGVAGISLKGERLLRRLAVESGGRFFFPSRDEQLSEVHDVLTGDVQNRYLITYTPENQVPDGTWRAITLKTGNPSFAIRARPGYFAPKPAPIRPTVEFTATDPEGRYLNVDAGDLQVLEDGVPQTVSSFEEAVDPVSIVLALDSSGSMHQKEADVVASARGFVEALQERDSLALALFGDKVLFAHDLTVNRSVSLEAIGGYHAVGGTALYDAISQSLLRLKTVQGRKVVVVMSDGRDENNAGTAAGSEKTFGDVVNDLKASGAVLFGIGLGTKVDRSPLQQLADQSGGRAFFPSDVAQLSTEFRRVVDDLRRRYVVGYTSSHEAHDGSWRKVEVRVTSEPLAVVRSTGGYSAPER
jgi:VWFA-related protein